MRKKFKEPLLKQLKSPDTKTVQQCIRMPPEEFQAIRAKAKKYAGGNISAWLRYSGQNYKPSPQELKEA